MSKYGQGWRQAATIAKARRWNEVVAIVALSLVFFAGVTAVVFLGGCASAPIAEKGKFEEIRTQETIKGLVRISQMGEDCSSEQEALKQVIAGILVSNGLPAPSGVEVRTLAGSSYCGFAQGTASEVTTLELGARNTAVAETTVYWNYITYGDLQKAQAVLAAMRPLPAAVSKTARNPAK